LFHLPCALGPPCTRTRTRTCACALIAALAPSLSPPQVTKTALRAASQIDHPLAQALAGLQATAAQLDAPVAGPQEDEQEEAEGAGASGGKKGSEKGAKKKKQQGAGSGREEEEEGEGGEGLQAQGKGAKAKWAAKAAQKEAQERGAQAVEQAAVDELAQVQYVCVMDVLSIQMSVRCPYVRL